MQLKRNSLNEVRISPGEARKQENPPRETLLWSDTMPYRYLKSSSHSTPSLIKPRRLWMGKQFVVEKTNSFIKSRLMLLLLLLRSWVFFFGNLSALNEKKVRRDFCVCLLSFRSSFLGLTIHSSSHQVSVLCMRVCMLVKGIFRLLLHSDNGK